MGCACLPVTSSAAGIRKVPKEFMNFMHRKRAQFFRNMATSLAAGVATTCACLHLAASLHPASLASVATWLAATLVVTLAVSYSAGALRRSSRQQK
jgi:small neutral amino acid transporter SnatA (MarC family)